MMSSSLTKDVHCFLVRCASRVAERRECEKGRTSFFLLETCYSWRESKQNLFHLRMRERERERAREREREREREIQMKSIATEKS